MLCKFYGKWNITDNVDSNVYAGISKDYAKEDICNTIHIDDNIDNMVEIQTTIFVFLIPTIFLFITGLMTIHYYDKYFIKSHKKSNSMKILLTLFNAILSFAFAYSGCRLAFGLAFVKAMQNF